MQRGMLVLHPHESSRAPGRTMRRGQGAGARPFAQVWEPDFKVSDNRMGSQPISRALFDVSAATVSIDNRYQEGGASCNTYTDGESVRAMSVTTSCAASVSGCTTGAVRMPLGCSRKGLTMSGTGKVDVIRGKIAEAAERCRKNEKYSEASGDLQTMALMLAQSRAFEKSISIIDSVMRG